MMIRAYDNFYLEDAMTNMADVLDYVANDCCLDKDVFFKDFIATGLADSFGKGVPKVVSGMSGAELAQEVFRLSNHEKYLNAFPSPGTRLDRTPDYWCGWVLAYYQWFTGESFDSIHKQFSFAFIESLYSTLHEAPEDKFVDTLLQRRASVNPPTKLKTLRKAIGMSQQELSKKSNVSLRSIQLYEQRQKSIDKAQAITLYRLAQTIGCQIEDLLEFADSSQ